MHSVGNLPARSEVGVPLNYADYYCLQALLRYRAIMNASNGTQASGGKLESAGCQTFN
jgi:hypothetical protein